MRELKYAFCTLLFIVALGTAHLFGQGVLLPDRMGQINDYAAQLGTEHRERLTELVERLNTRSEVKANLLITLIDPFSNTSRLASALWESWELPNENTLLLIFVREQYVWYFHWEASPDLRAIMSELITNTQIFDGAIQLVKDRRIADAAVEAFEQLTLKFVGPEPEGPATQPFSDEDRDSVEANEEAAGNNSIPDENIDETGFESFTTESIFTETSSEDQTLWYILGGIGTSVLLFLIIRAIFAMTCPQCGGRLQTRDARTNTFHSRRSTHRNAKRTKFCPNCRYQRSAA